MSEGAATAVSWYSKMKNHLPELSQGLAIAILIINIFFPGIGTMCLACIGGQFDKDHLIIGLIQFVLAMCIIGWIWSIMWGVFLVMKAKK
jgi:hypothetical protein